MAECSDLLEWRQLILVSHYILTFFNCNSSPSLYVQGKPRPVVTWFKDDAVLDDSSVGIRTSDVDTIIFIRTAERSHSGKYTLAVQIDTVSDSADIEIQIVGQCGHDATPSSLSTKGVNIPVTCSPLGLDHCTRFTLTLITGNINNQFGKGLIVGT